MRESVMSDMICIVGHFGKGKTLLNGQTIKTDSIFNALSGRLDPERICTVDSCGGIKRLPGITKDLIRAFKNCGDIIIMPAENGLKYFVPVCSALNKLYKRRLRYIVVGGWLPEYLREHGNIASKLKKFHSIYVETNAMKRSLEQIGFGNVFVMPNFKNIKALSLDELKTEYRAPFRFCTFSRVMKEKGIEDAALAVEKINLSRGAEVCSLDIYGQIDEAQKQWFDGLTARCSSSIKYAGMVDPDESVNVLKDYFALIFPTYYSGEGFAGTLIDAFAAGLPVIASDWRYNSETVEDGVTGLLFRAKDEDMLIEKLEWAIDHSDAIMKMKPACIDKAHEYSPEKALEILGIYRDTVAG